MNGRSKTRRPVGEKLHGRKAEVSEGAVSLGIEIGRQGVGEQRADILAVAMHFPNNRGADEGVLRRSDKKYAFDSTVNAVYLCDWIFVVEVGGVSQTAQDKTCAVFFGKVNRQGIVFFDKYIRLVGKRLAYAAFHECERKIPAFVGVAPNTDHDLIEQRYTFQDDVFMPPRKGIKGAGKNSNTWFHEQRSQGLGRE